MEDRKISKYSEYLKAGFRALFAVDNKNLLNYINDVIYPTIGVLSSVVLSYATLSTPDFYSAKNVFTNTNCIRDYKHFKRHGLPMFDYNMSMEEIMLGLSRIPNVGIRLNSYYVVPDIKVMFCLDMPTDNSMRFGYDKFSITYSTTKPYDRDSVRHLRTCLISKFIMFNYADTKLLYKHFRNLNLVKLQVYAQNIKTRNSNVAVLKSSTRYAQNLRELLKDNDIPENIKFSFRQESQSEFIYVKLDGIKVNRCEPPSKIKPLLDGYIVNMNNLSNNYSDANAINKYQVIYNSSTPEEHTKKILYIFIMGDS